MRFKYFSKLVLTLSIIFLSFGNCFANEIVNIKLDDIRGTEDKVEAKRKKQIIFTPLQSRKITNLPNDDYAKEFPYFFQKVGFKSSPVSFIFFENGSIYNTNPNWLFERFDSNIGRDFILIGLIYNNSFDIDNFKDQIIHFEKEVLTENYTNTDISSVNDFSVRKFKVDGQNQTVTINFSEVESSTEILKGFFDEKKFSSDIKVDLEVVGFTFAQGMRPDTVYESTVTIKNKSASNFILGEKAVISLKTAKDSPFYANGIWPTLRQANNIKEGVIFGTKDAGLFVSYKTPLLPGEYSENFIFYLNDKELGKADLKVSVADNGQKVLRIKGRNIIYVTVRYDPINSSPELSKAPVGQQYIFTEKKDGFYKISISGREGWVSEKDVEVLKG